MQTKTISRLKAAVVWLSLGLGVWLLGACGFLSSPKTIHVNQSLLQKATEKKWPEITKMMRDNGMEAQAPKVILIPDKQRVGAQFDVVVQTGVLGTVLRGKMQMSGVPSYSAEKEAIVLKEFAVDSFELTNATSLLDGLARRMVGSTVGQKVGVDVPIYFIPKDKLTYMGKTWLPEKITVQEQQLDIVLAPQGQ